MNFTWNNKVEFGKLVRLGLEFEFVPLLLEAQSEFYTTTMLNDNCYMLSAQLNTLQMNVKLRKNFATCSNNLHRYFVESKTFTDFLNKLLSDHIFLLFEMDCIFEEELGDSS